MTVEEKVGAEASVVAATRSLPPALKTHGLVVVIDDDPHFLHTLQDLLSCDDYTVAAFTDPGALHEFMATRVAAIAGDRACIKAISLSQTEVQGTVATDALRYFASPARFDVPLVLISDYAMPQETGVSVCSKYGNFGLQRVLLTGVADTGIAVSAFNAAAIDQYVQKQGSAFPRSIIDAVSAQFAVAAARRGAALAETLADDFLATVASPGVSAALREYLATLEVGEYVMLGEPQGLFAATRRGEALWLQLETERSLRDLEDILQEANVDDAALERVRDRRSLVAVEWMQQIGEPQQEQAAVVLSESPLLLASAYRLSLPTDLRPAKPTAAF